MHSANTGTHAGLYQSVCTIVGTPNLDGLPEEGFPDARLLFSLQDGGKRDSGGSGMWLPRWDEASGFPWLSSWRCSMLSSSYYPYPYASLCLHLYLYPYQKSRLVLMIGWLSGWLIL